MNRFAAAAFGLAVLGVSGCASGQPKSPSTAVQHSQTEPVAYDRYCYDDVGEPVPYYDQADPNYTLDQYCAGRTVIVAEQRRRTAEPALTSVLPSQSLPANNLPLPVPDMGILRR